MKIQDIVAYQLCCGCGACKYLHPDHIDMVDVPKLGRRPHVRDQTTKNNLFEDVSCICPGIGLSHKVETLRQPGLVASLRKAWGPVFELWEGYAADPEIRFKGSSGGAISALALYCIEKEKMDGALQTTADSEKPYLNITIMSRSRDDILRATGSRYSPASPCDQLQLIEDACSPCVFIGKPCDVAAVNNVSQQRAGLKKNLGLTIACFCAGTPSTYGTLEMLRKMGIDKPASLNELRYRGYGCPGKTTAKHTASDGPAQSELTYQESWGDILQKYRQWRCYICPDHTGEFADVAVGDSWYREPIEGELGTSLILARTQRGRKVIQNAISTGYLVAEKKCPEVLPDSQPNLLKNRSTLWGRLLTLRLLRTPYPRYNHIPLFHLWISELSAKEKAQSVYGTIKRIFTKNLKKRYIIKILDQKEI